MTTVVTLRAEDIKPSEITLRNGKKYPFYCAYEVQESKWQNDENWRNQLMSVLEKGLLDWPDLNFIAIGVTERNEITVITQDELESTLEAIAGDRYLENATPGQRVARKAGKCQFCAAPYCDDRKADYIRELEPEDFTMYELGAAALEIADPEEWAFLRLKPLAQLPDK